MSQLWNVNACVGLTCNPETIFGKLWELFEPNSQTLEVIVCSAAISVLNVGRIFVDWKSYSRWTLDKKKIGFSIPREWILRWCEFVRSLIEDMRSELLNKTYMDYFVPSILEHPGPPLSQRTRSSVSGLFFDVIKT